MRASFLSFAPSILVLSGCSTFTELSKPDQMDKAILFAGTRENLKALSGRPSRPYTCSGPISAVDLPFSLAADTVLLPVTLPWAAIHAYEWSDRMKRRCRCSCTSSIGNRAAGYSVNLVIDGATCASLNGATCSISSGILPTSGNLECGH